MLRMILRTRRKAIKFLRDFERLGFHVPLLGLIVVVGFSYNRLPAEVQHFFLALSSVYLVHLFSEFVAMRRLLNLLDKDAPLLKACGTHGITAIYESRAAVWREIAGEDDALLSENPEHVWAIGISLSADFQLQHFLERFVQSKPKDLRILLLDALTSTGVFRDCLESSREDVLDTIPKNSRLYFDHNVYSQFEAALKLLWGHRQFKKFQTSVRFYRHTPLCWMVRVDDVLFFQPYTFGSSRQNDAARTIGCEMPIFRIEKKQAGKMFRILTDHFTKLWSTSDGSVYATKFRNNSRDSILDSIFETRKDWFCSVRDALYKTELSDDGTRQDRRSEARGRGTDQCGRFILDYNGVPIDAGIADYTNDSLALWVGSSQPYPAMNDVVTAGYTPGPPRTGVENDIAKHYIEQFNGKKLRVRSIYEPSDDGSVHALDRRLVLCVA